ncbi:DUF3037 domain-containing protein [Flavisolibacter nicotianae]|uniref:DUF3037 domain-containing protein n=1 Tax=Flavisolibacter nicotianae TaxID=2364882 RepID=UPI000EB0E409|nr:DUF3037 domain-containing protein [Flavisolibacter nicotianae]
MPGKHLFEYAVVRVVPKVEREEFLNVGIVLYCKQHRYLHTFFHLDEERLKAFAPSLDLAEVQAYLAAFEKISQGAKDGGPIAKLDLPSRFRWLTATRSTIVQVSKTHVGLCEDLEKAGQKLLEQLVL